MQPASVLWANESFLHPNACLIPLGFTLDYKLCNSEYCHFLCSSVLCDQVIESQFCFRKVNLLRRGQEDKLGQMLHVCLLVCLVEFTVVARMHIPVYWDERENSPSLFI